VILLVFDNDYSLSLNVCFQIRHTSGQIDILCVAFREISSGNKDHCLTVSIVRELISKHQKIIIFLNKIEDFESRIEDLLLHHADLIYVEYVRNLLLRVHDHNNVPLKIRISGKCDGKIFLS